jgi:hypothetical protein
VYVVVSKCVGIFATSVAIHHDCSQTSRYRCFHTVLLIRRVPNCTPVLYHCKVVVVSKCVGIFATSVAIHHDCSQTSRYRCFHTVLLIRRLPIFTPALYHCKVGLIPKRTQRD